MRALFLAPFGKRFQFAIQIRLATKVALDLAAGRPWQAGLADKLDPVQVQFVVLDDRAAHGAKDLVKVGAAMLAVNLVNDDQLFAVVPSD